MNKIYKLNELKLLVESIKNQNKKIVFTNGRFDILHLGHIEYLKKAKELGDFLIVAINSDKSPYFKTKPNRPINDEKQRSIIIASLMFVDAVILFDDETPYNLIESIKPDVLVKGNDYKIENISGYDVVINNGGVVLTIDLLSGYSSTNIINKIKN